MYCDAHCHSLTLFFSVSLFSLSLLSLSFLSFFLFLSLSLSFPSSLSLSFPSSLSLPPSLPSLLLSSSLPLLQFPDLASFLIARACRSTTLANYFHWFVYVQCQEDKDPVSKEKYESIRSKFLDDLRNVSGNVAVTQLPGIKVLCTNTFYFISNGTYTPTATNNVCLFVTLHV